MKFVFPLISVLVISTASAKLRGNRSLQDFPALGDTLAALRETDAVAANLVEKYHPVFDMDSDSCLPAAAISRTGRYNQGIPTSGDITEGCRSPYFLELSNTYHRWDRTQVNGKTYEVHMCDLYFEKDQVSSLFGGGHRHDIETVIMIFENNSPVWMGVSAHGNYNGDLTRRWSDVPTWDGHPKVVHHKDGITTHALRFAKDDEYRAENPQGEWVFPQLASWFEVTGDGLTNSEMRSILNRASFSPASFKITDSACRSEVDKIREEIQDKGAYYVPTFDFGLNSDRVVPTGEFSEEGAGVAYCPQDGSQSLLTGLYCKNDNCDNLRLQCTYVDNLLVGNTYWTGSFSEEQGLGSCPPTYAVTGIKCSGRYCDNLQLQCKQILNKELVSCSETAWFSEELGFREVPKGAYAVGFRCRGSYCDDKKIRYCYAN